MAKELGFFHTSYKTWLCNTALFALVCAAFTAGVLLGPIISSRGKDRLQEVRCNRDSSIQKQNPSTKCVFPKDLKTLMNKWNRSLDDLIEEKMANFSKGSITPLMRKLSRAKDASTKKVLRGKISLLVVLIFLFCLICPWIVWFFSITWKHYKRLNHRLLFQSAWDADVSFYTLKNANVVEVCVCSRFNSSSFSVRFSHLRVSNLRHGILC